tara:strand:+ start:1404 stop:2894 length:1491 start_codon:yes stop_codon:yes gene_type:complete
MAGSSDMFTDAGYDSPKWLIDIDGKPMIQHVVDQFPEITDILFICKEEDLQDPKTCDKLNSMGGKVVKIKQNSSGPVDTVLQASEHISDDKEIIVSYCDHGMVWDCDSFLEEARSGDFEGAMTCYRDFHPHMLGTNNLYTFCLQENNKLLEVQDKEPFTEDRKSQFVSSDVFYFKTGRVLKKYFEEADQDSSMNGFIAHVYNLLVKNNLSVCIHEVDKMLLWATPEDLETYKRWSNYFNKDSSDKTPEQDFTVIIPMCGKGSRFVKEGYELPKPLLPIGDSPMFAGVVECLPKHENNVFICSKEHNADELIRSYYPKAKIKSIDFVTEGFAESCELGINLMDEDDPIMISPCDNGVSYDEDTFLRMVADEDNDVIFWVTKGSQATKANPAMYTWVSVDDDNCIRDMVYKQKPDSDLGTTPVSIGIMYFRKAKYLLEGLRKNRDQNIRPTGELCMDSVAHQLAKGNYKVKVFEVDHYACWGTPDDYESYNFWREYCD